LVSSSLGPERRLEFRAEVEIGVPSVDALKAEPSNLGGRSHRVATAFLASCGGSNHNTLPGTVAVTVDVSQYELGQRYLRIIGPTNAALAAFKTRVAGYDKSTTDGQLAADLAPLVVAIQQGDKALLPADWPPPVAADVKGLVTANRAFVVDLRAAKSQGGLSSGRWVNQPTKYNRKLAAAANVVRADLGLPPAKP
jgi:hypothetical protein